MEQQKTPYYLGIDINDKYAMISYYQLNKKEPDTVSAVAGSENYQIPVVLAKRRGLGQWYYGDEARRMAKSCEMICIDNLLRRALSGDTIVIEEETYEAEDLLALFINKLILLPEKMGNPMEFDRLVITLERLNKENMELFWRIAPKLELDKTQFTIIDHKESFYYFALNQPEELWLHDVYLFECELDVVRYYGLHRNMQSRPQVITIEEGERISLGDESKDNHFYKYLIEAFENKVISSVYLVGDGFNGNWMKSSLNYLCRGRRAFIGNNLFSKGACYAAAVRDQEENWNYIYMGENEMKFNLSLKVSNKGTPEFYNLISAGKNWFETRGCCEVILKDVPEVNFWKQLPHSREAKIETLELSDLPKRPSRTTRVQILAQPVSSEKIEITIKDLGFGEFFPATDKEWKYTMSI